MLTMQDHIETLVRNLETGAFKDMSLALGVSMTGAILAAAADANVNAARSLLFVQTMILGGQRDKAIEIMQKLIRPSEHDLTALMNRSVL